MRSSIQAHQYICLPCRLDHGRQTHFLQDVEHNLRINFKSSQPKRSFHESYNPLLPTKNIPTRISPPQKQRREPSQWRSRSSSAQTRNSNLPIEEVTLSRRQVTNIGQLNKLKKRLQEGLSQLPEQEKSSGGIPIETVLKTIDPRYQIESPYFSMLQGLYAGKSFQEVDDELQKISSFRRPSEAIVKNEEARDILIKLGIIGDGTNDSEKAAYIRPVKTIQHRKIKSSKSKTRVVNKTPSSDNTSLPRPRKVLSRSPKSDTTSVKENLREKRRAARQALKEKTAKPAEETSLPNVNVSTLTFEPVETEAVLTVPTLSFGLSRVLFNPGVYQLQDPRSRVYNFDPYLEQLMPISEFNFDALNKYVTSSEDDILLQMASKYNKKYVGSSSSTSAALSQFHFLLSAWRPVTISRLSKEFTEKLDRFTVISRAPSAIYLRWKNGVYAVDADKEHDSANVLMSLGHSMEKLLTLEKEDFERYRRIASSTAQEDVKTHPESYHYTTMENFLFRSQLDAVDKRLPGTGMFDLKTRAVAGIRMNLSNYQVGKGYEIKDRFGTWESYEREYYDMIRAAFLKYSLQVRMGRMDGIFVAYHNITRIFGFQYISLPELDLALHGQPDPSLGDQEFRLSVRLMTEVFDQATKAFPNQSLRFYFETREPSKTKPLPYMQIFAEPVGEEEIQRRQIKSKERVSSMQKQLLAAEIETERMIQPTPTTPEVGADIESSSTRSFADNGSGHGPSTAESTTADSKFLDELSSPEFQNKISETISSPTPHKDVAMWTLQVYSRVNGRRVERPENLTPKDQWTIHYDLQRISTEKVPVRYETCQKRRKSAMAKEADEDNYFLRKLRNLSLQGVAWRQKQDDLDSNRDRVVLFEPTKPISNI